MAEVAFMAITGFAGGVIGSMVGLGGGVFIVPVLTLFLGVPIHDAVAASLLAVVATSTAGSINYVRQGLINLRLGVTMETALTAGALTGGLVGAMLGREVLSAVFGGVLLAVSLYMGLRRNASPPAPSWDEDLGRLGAAYCDPSLGREVRYRVRGWPLGLAAGLIAGNVSGLLGVGGGFLTVPAMRVGMGVPIRASVATSSLMLGVTACAGALVYLARGMVDPVTTVPVVLGVTVGAALGSRLASRVRSSVLVVIMAVVLFAFAVQMLLAAAGISLR
jgi:uncharacterized membrane protein YfcA